MSVETEASVAANVAGPSSRMIIQQCCSATLEVRPSAADTDAEFVQVFVCSFGITASDTQSWVILQNSWLPLVAVSLGLITLSIYLFFLLFNTFTVAQNTQSASQTTVL